MADLALSALNLKPVLLEYPLPDVNDLAGAVGVIFAEGLDQKLFTFASVRIDRVYKDTKNRVSDIDEEY